MKKCCAMVLTFMLLIMVMPLSVYAAETSPAFLYELTVDGTDEKTVRTGDVITVVLHLVRTDADKSYSMYAMQDEIRYDSNFFELVEGSEIIADRIESTDIAMRDDYREFYMNFLSLNGGDTWNATTLIGSFQLRVTGTSGVTQITNEDYLVSLKDGSGSYPCEANEVKIIISTDCTIRFESNGGTEIEDFVAVYGETIIKPQDPKREGKYFVGWFKDIDCTEEWDFETETVTGNMTLYAKWSDSPVSNMVPDHPKTLDAFNWLWLLIAVPGVAMIVLVIVFFKKRNRAKH